jgi:predicted anti-sigma-YlaC factor YlaD
MNCRKTEILISRSLDGALPVKDVEALDLHLSGCRRCRDVLAEYKLLMTSFQNMGTAESKPYFVQRVEAGIKDSAFVYPFLAWKRWGLITLSLSMLFIGLLVGGIFLSNPPAAEIQELSRSETLLLRELNPFQETRTLFEAANAEQKNMMLIFSSLEETDIRRYFP